jgi:protein-L-isoaspartate(D-aspartate) O-methyltransferase
MAGGGQVSFEEDRERMVKNLQRSGYVKSKEVAEAMRSVPRHVFVPRQVVPSAYNDTPLPIGKGQTISAPHMVAMMLEKLDLMDGQKVLEIGGGSGYHAALVAYMIGEEGQVISMERIEARAERAREVLKGCGLEQRVVMVVGDGSLGWEKMAPYDRIFITCASPQIPPPLLEQLKDGEKLLIPLGSLHLQTLVLVEKKGNKIKKKSYGGCMFVPLIGEFGFS